MQLTGKNIAACTYSIILNTHLNILLTIIPLFIFSHYAVIDLFYGSNHLFYILINSVNRRLEIWIIRHHIEFVCGSVKGEHEVIMKSRGSAEDDISRAWMVVYRSLCHLRVISCACVSNILQARSSSNTSSCLSAVYSRHTPDKVCIRLFKSRMLIKYVRSMSLKRLG